MSIMMTMKLDKDVEQPPWFSDWYSELLPEYLSEFEYRSGAVPHTIGKLVSYFDIKINPLLKVAGPNFSRGEFPNDEVFAKYQAQRKAAWQSPQKLIDCLRGFVEKIESDPEVFSRLQVEDAYFSQGGFTKELHDLIRMAEWAKENGVKRLRLEAG